MSNGRLYDREDMAMMERQSLETRCLGRKLA
jgi:hypothetical protein